MLGELEFTEEVMRTWRRSVWMSWNLGPEFGRSRQTFRRGGRACGLCIGAMTGAKSWPGVIFVHVEDNKLVAGGSDTTIESLQKALTAYRAQAVTKLAELKF